VKSFALSLLASVISFAGPLTGPMPGFILDARSGSLRPVLGIPGAMQLGDRVSLSFRVVSADFDPNGNFAVVISDEAPSHVYVVRNLTNPTVTDLGTIADNSSVLAINNAGQSAVLSAPGQLQFLTSLTTSPVLANALPTNGLLGAITAGVVDDAGQCALLGTVSDAAGALESLCADGSSQRFVLRTGLRISAIALTNRGQDAILADSAGQQILRVTGYAQALEVSVLATSHDGISTPIGLQLNGQQVVVADSGASSIFVIDLNGQSPIRSIVLNGVPVRFKLLADRTVALLSDPTLAPFSIFDLQAMQPFFIPTN
jgi:hypothetical protein